MQHTIRQRNGISTIEIEGNIDASCAPELRDLLKGMIESGARKMVINLEKVGFMDSSGLGIFVAAYKMMNQEGGAIRFAKPQKSLEKVFELTRTHKVFEIFDTVDQALESFK